MAILTDDMRSIVDAKLIRIWRVPLFLAFGPTAKLERRNGEWRAGFVSRYGFHVRGTFGTPRGAVARAMVFRLESDPSPVMPDGYPAGTFNGPAAASSASACGRARAGTSDDR